VLKGDEIFEYFYSQTNNIDENILKYFHDKIKKHFLVNVEKNIQNNYRYHVNYFIFLGKLFKLKTLEEANNDLLPIMLKTLRSPTCTLPVKR
jgi:hypothetical protein